MYEILKKQLSSVDGAILILTTENMINIVKQETKTNNNVKIICV